MTYTAQAIVIVSGLVGVGVSARVARRFQSQPAWVLIWLTVLLVVWLGAAILGSLATDLICGRDCV